MRVHEIIKPGHFDRVPGWSCGLNAAKWVVAAHGEQNFESDGHSHGFPFPGRVVRLIESHGLKAEKKRLRDLSNRERLSRLDTELYLNGPQLLLVSGYSKWLPHWIVLCAKKGGRYFLYDPTLPSDELKERPVGNHSVTGAELLQMWLMPYWGAVFFRWRHLFVEVSKYGTPSRACTK